MADCNDAFFGLAVLPCEACNPVTFNEQPAGLPHVLCPRHIPKEHGGKIAAETGCPESGVRGIRIDCGDGESLETQSRCSLVATNHGHRDQPLSTFWKDLKQRGMLLETLIFGQGKRETCSDKNTRSTMTTNTMWIAGADIRTQTTGGETDDFDFQSVTKTSPHPRPACHPFASPEMQSPTADRP